MAEYIDKSALYEKIAQLEELARNSYLETPSNSPCYSRYMAQLNERTAFKHLIADFPAADVAPVQKWISVKDRLPENEQDVIICAERRHYSNPNRFIRIVAKAFYTDGKHDTEHTAYVWDNDYIDMEYDDENDAFLIPEGWWESIEYGEEFSAVSDFVTHWMPIPEPPKEE